MTEPAAAFNTKWWRGAGRALRLACPRCGRAKVFRRFALMNEVCAVCGLRFDRGNGYWLGAMMFNMAFAIGGVVAILVLMIWLTTPDTNWDAVVAVLVAASIVLPLACFPFSRTLWIAAERAARLGRGAED